MFSARISAGHSVFYSYLNMFTTVKIWHFMIRRIGDCALSRLKRFIFTDDPVAI